MKAFEYEKIHSGNLSDARALLQRASPRWRPAEYYTQKHLTPWGGGHYHGWLAYDKTRGEAVSMSMLLPVRVVLPNGEQVAAAQMTEAFTLPEYRGRGLLSTLLRKAIAEQQQAGCHLIFVMTNQVSRNLVVHQLGFAHTHTMEHYTLKINTFPLESLCRRLRISGLFRWWAGKILAPFIAPEGFVLENSVLGEGYGGVLHDRHFFEYKSFTFNRLCRWNGIDAWLKCESGLLVGDVALPEGCTNAQMDKWLRTLRTIARWAGLRQIVFQTFAGSRLSQQLSARFPARPSWAVCCRTSDAGIGSVLDKIRFVYGDFDTF